MFKNKSRIHTFISAKDRIQGIIKNPSLVFIPMYVDIRSISTPMNRSVKVFLEFFMFII